jgi:S1-C subfamily serine protease
MPLVTARRFVPLAAPSLGIALMAWALALPSNAQQAFSPAPSPSDPLASPRATVQQLSPVPSTSRVVPVSAEAPPSDASRRAEFEALDREVAALEPQLGIVKRVVRLVTPSVVHIEARPTGQRRLRSDEQEAGSGVVVRFGGRDYVLTNRHVIRYSSAPHIRVHLADGSPLVPIRVWSDSDTDVAVMALDAAASTSLAGAIAPARGAPPPPATGGQRHARDRRAGARLWQPLRP